MTNRTPPALRDGTWIIDPERSEIGFAVKAMWGLVTVRGVFREFGGRLDVRPSTAAGELTIEAASLDTRNNRRDKHLRSVDFFDAERHPQIVFTARSVTAASAAVTITGEIAIGPARVPLEVPVTVERLADDVARLAGNTSIPREAAGLTWNWLGMVGRDAVLHARLTVKR